MGEEPKPSDGDPRTPAESAVDPGAASEQPVGWWDEPPLSPSVLGSGPLGMGVPVARFRRSTPRDEDGDGDVPIPAAVLWAMKYDRHLRLGHRDDETLRATLGADDRAVYVIDDGPNRCMLGRVVGASGDGEGASNVVEVERHRNAAQVPPEYLPGHPFIQFEDG